MWLYGKCDVHTCFHYSLAPVSDVALYGECDVHTCFHYSLAPVSRRLLDSRGLMTCSFVA